MLFCAQRQTNDSFPLIARLLVTVYVLFSLAGALHQHHGDNRAQARTAAAHAAATADAPSPETDRLRAADDCALCQIAAQPVTAATTVTLPDLRPVERTIHAAPLPGETQLLPLAALSRYASRAPPVA